MVISYTPLEKDFLSTAIGDSASFSSSNPPSLFSSISLLFVASFVIIVVTASVYFIRAGVLRMSASEKGIHESKAEFKRVSLALLGVFSFWLIFSTFNKDMISGNVGLSSLRAKGVEGVPSTASPVSTLPPVTPSGAVSGGNISSRIFTVASNAIGRLSTSGIPGTNNGRLACAYAVNQVLKGAELSPIGSLSVVEMENGLKNGRGSAITQSSSIPGDIVIEAGGGHVGICLNNGCSQVISNSSSKAMFSWISGPDFSPSYSNGVGRFYHVNN